MAESRPLAVASAEPVNSRKSLVRYRRRHDFEKRSPYLEGMCNDYEQYVAWGRSPFRPLPTAGFSYATNRCGDPPRHRGRLGPRRQVGRLPQQYLTIDKIASAERRAAIFNRQRGTHVCRSTSSSGSIAVTSERVRCRIASPIKDDSSHQPDSRWRFLPLRQGSATHC